MLGSIRLSVRTVRESGFRCTVKSSASSTSSGSGTENSRSYRRTSVGREWDAETQWMVPLTSRPSGIEPPFVSGSYMQCTSRITPFFIFLRHQHSGTTYP